MSAAGRRVRAAWPRRRLGRGEAILADGEPERLGLRDVGKHDHAAGGLPAASRADDARLGQMHLRSVGQT